MRRPCPIVACDLPNLAPTTVIRLISALDDHDAAIAHSDRPEPLCAVWSYQAGPPLRKRFEAGERAMHRAIDGLDVAWVDVAQADVHNINAPGDLGTL